MTEVDEFRWRLSEFCGVHGIPLDEEAIRLCVEHYAVLLRWNRKMNLVGDLSLDSAVRRHYGESLWLARMANLQRETILDFGSGAGFPGVGFAALYSEASIVLAEARVKRSVFLQESFRSAGNVSVYNGDANCFADEFSFVCGRAVDPDVVLQFAVSRTASLGVLVSASDACILEAHVLLAGWRVERHPLPWRPEAEAFLAWHAA